MWWRAATTFATIFCKSDQTVLCGGKVSAKFASKSYESARNRTKASLIGRNRKSERKFDIVRKFPNSDGTVQNWREVEQKPDSRVAQIEANDTWYFRFFNFCLISFFLFLCQRLNNRGTGSFNVENEKAKLYRGSKDQVSPENGCCDLG